MQNVVIAKPYKFVPPDRGRFWPAVFRSLLRPFLAKVWGVTTVEIVGIESLRSALRERASVLLAPNHCRSCDRTVVAVLGAQDLLHGGQTDALQQRGRGPTAPAQAVCWSIRSAAGQFRCPRLTYRWLLPSSS
jgi:hypothetical protein